MYLYILVMHLYALAATRKSAQIKQDAFLVKKYF